MTSPLHLSLDDPAFLIAAANVRLLGLDFDGVLTDNMVYVFEDGREAVRCSRHEGFGLRNVEKAGVEPMIISTEANRVVTARALKLQVACVQNIADKVAAMQSILTARNLDWSAVCFVGNDVNDRGVLELVGLPVIVADAHESLDNLRAFRTRTPGGHGAVREICDAIARARNI